MTWKPAFLKFLIDKKGGGGPIGTKKKARESIIGEQARGKSRQHSDNPSDQRGKQNHAHLREKKLYRRGAAREGTRSGNLTQKYQRCMDYLAEKKREAEGGKK